MRLLPRSWSHRLLMVFILLLTCVVCAYTVFSIQAGVAREIAIARVTPTPAVDRYKAWSRPDSPSARPASFDAFAKVLETYRGEDGAKLKWMDLIGKNNIREKCAEWMDGLEFEEGRRLCESSKDLLAEIRAIAAMGGPFYPLFETGGAVYTQPPFMEVSIMGQLLSVDAVYQARNGAKDAALEDILSIMRLGDAISPEPIIISQVIRMMLNEYANNALVTVFAPGELSPEQASRVITQVRLGAHHQDLVDAIKGEMYMASTRLEEIRNGVNKPMGIPGVSWQAWFIEKIALSAPARPWLELDEAEYIETCDTLINLAGKPYFEVKEDLSALRERIRNLPATRIMTRRSFDSGLVDVCLDQAKHEARLGLIKTGLLAEQQAAATGAAPTSLAFAGPAATDPFTGEPFVYRPDGATFVLYSVGDNQKDDGGVGGMKDDIVWRGK